MRILLGLLLLFGLLACGEEVDDFAGRSQGTNGFLGFGFIDVPRDYSNLNAGSYEMQYRIWRATNPAARIGALVVHFGGPGSSAVRIADEFRSFIQRIEGRFPGSITERFDIVGLDELGVGSSEPLDCKFVLNRNRLTGFQGHLEEAERFADACDREHGPLMNQLGTLRLARDLDRLRAELGEEVLHFYGASYGTLVGLAYASEFPNRVGRFVLDAVLEPRLTVTELVVQQTAGFERAFDAWLDWCTRQSSCAFGGDDPAAAFDAWVASLSPYDPNPEGLSQALIRGGVYPYLYSEFNWSVLDVALRIAQSGDGSVFRQALIDFDSTFNEDAFDATMCADRPRPTFDELEALQSEVEAAAPRLGGARFGDFFSCLYWPATPEAIDWDGRLQSMPPLMLVGAIGDAATPYEWSVSVRAAAPFTRMVTAPGYFHATALSGLRSCVDDAAASYLLTGVLPNVDVDCR